MHFEREKLMARRYTLDTKINALNMLDKHDGDLLTVSSKLTIPASTLSQWRKKESDLRHDHRQKLHRQFTRLKAELQVKMLDRGMKIIACMDDETLSKAPLNQLATALGSLVNHALKLDEVIEDTDEQTEKVIRIEYFYDGEVQDVPPWTGASEGQPRAVQGSRMRETVGQNGIGQDSSIGERDNSRETWLVASTDPPNIESTLEGLENDRQERDWYHD
jgi:hypothetical protein